jgi:hypothetical protein
MYEGEQLRLRDWICGRHICSKGLLGTALGSGCMYAEASSSESLGLTICSHVEQCSGHHPVYIGLLYIILLSELHSEQ